MSDITAIGLSIGEETTKRAIDSVKKQTLQPKEIIIIEKVTPFYKALNFGASKVKTEFFIQVDSDMILDENCFQDLRNCMTDGVGLAIGQLRDPLMGIESGIKIFRRICFDKVQFKHSVATDNVFYRDLEKYGWKTRYILNLGNTEKKNNFRHTFGEHRPAYTPLYTYARYYLLGTRYRYLKYPEYLKWRFQELHVNNHSLSLIAQIAMAHGVFSKEIKDLPKTTFFSNNEDFEFLEKFLESKNIYEIVQSELSPLLSLKPKKLFRNFYKLGIQLRNFNSFPSFKHCMDIIGKCQDNFAWLAKVALCHGLFSKVYNEERASKNYKMLKGLI